MNWVLSVSFGELTLKGANRRLFENRAIGKIKKSLRGIDVDGYFMQQGKFYIRAKREDFPEMMDRIKKVFGIIYISPCLQVDKTVEAMEAACVEVMKEKNYPEGTTFKVMVNRVDKRFVPKSPELSAILGGAILKGLPQMKVDVHQPEVICRVDVKEEGFVYVDRVKGYGGLPIGSGGRGLLLLSGGIDSPVAGFMMAKRGVELGLLHFHSYPFTSERAEDKVKRLAGKLAGFVGSMPFYSVNLLPIQEAIGEHCREREMTILSRRFMMRIGERLCEDQSFNVMITGESLGQVASQTIQSMSVIERAVETTILRPLVAIDKTEIIEIAQDIDTYDISIEPFEDCCTVFLPSRPVTKPRLSDVLKSEEALDVEALVDAAIANMRFTMIDVEEE